MRLYPLICCALVLLISCHSTDNDDQDTQNEAKGSDKTIVSGHITYKISYPEIDSTEGSLVLKMLPNTMDMTYKGNRYKMSSEAGLGMFETGYICDGNHRHMDYYLRLPSNKMASRFNEKGIAKIYPYIPDYTVNYIDTSTVISGLPCKKAEVIFEQTNDTLPVWYCPSFPLTDPNWCNPYHQISGLLVDYEIFQYGIRAHMRVSEWKEGSVSDEEIRIKEGFEIVSNSAIQQKLKDMLFGF